MIAENSGPCRGVPKFCKCLEDSPKFCQSSEKGYEGFAGESKKKTSIWRNLDASLPTMEDWQIQDPSDKWQNLGSPVQWMSPSSTGTSSSLFGSSTITRHCKFLISY